jgi:superfamily I DNA and/or RNA helicase
MNENEVYKYYKIIAAAIKENGNEHFFKPLKDDILNSYNNSMISEKKLKNDWNDNLKRPFLANFFLGKLDHQKKTIDNLIFPFGINDSQQKAVETALNNQCTLIQGPPGTGKTQTILNLLANIYMQRMTVAVISKNNSAVANVVEKLSDDVDDDLNLELLIQHLGDAELTNAFVENFKATYQEKIDELSKKIKEWNLKHRINNSFVNYKDFKKVLADINSYNQMQTEFNEMKVSLERHRLFLEKQLNYFELYVSDLIKKIYKKIEENKVQKWIYKKEKWLYKKDKLSNRKRRFLKRNFNIAVKNLSELGMTGFVDFIEFHKEKSAVEIFQKKLVTFKKKYTNKEEALKHFLQYSKAEFYNSILKVLQNTEFKYEDYVWPNVGKYFMNNAKIAPIICCSANSLSGHLRDNIVDYLIIDEASQISSLDCLGVMARARNVIIVGDQKQLEQINNNDIIKQIHQVIGDVDSEIKAKYNCENNIMTVIQNVFGATVPSIMLREHYRCHPMIIDFCNQMYYNNQLISMNHDKYNNTDNPLTLIEVDTMNYVTSRVGGTMTSKPECNQVLNLVRSKKYQSGQLGIISPYRGQVNFLQDKLSKNAVTCKVNTIHKFQGQGCDEIIFCTTTDSDNDIVKFVGTREMINVMVSRAKDKLTVIAPDKIVNNHEIKSDLNELINYIKARDAKIEVHQMGIFSSLSYSNIKNTLQKYQELISKDKPITEVIIRDYLIDYKNRNNLRIEIYSHYRLKYLIKNQTGFNGREKSFINHPWSHVDFLLVDKISNQPVCVIEVDGKMHETEKVMFRDNIKDTALKNNKIPIIRLKTNPREGDVKTFEQLETVFKQMIAKGIMK